jgi:hypothetical protein
MFPYFQGEERWGVKVEKVSGVVADGGEVEAEFGCSH